MRSLLSLVALAVALPANELAALALSTSRIRTHHHRTHPRSKSPPSPDDVSPQVPIRILHPSSTVEREALDRTAAKEDNLSPFLRDMVDEQRELQLNVGRAMDVLRKDYPYFLKRAPDFSIYHDSISLSASDGQIQLTSLPSYKKALRVVRTMLSLLYDTDRSVIQSRMVYDSARRQIRVSFNAMLVPKLGALTMGRPVHVDGISVYSLDLSPTRGENGEERNEGAGKINEHKIERILVNGVPLKPPYFNAFGLEAMTGQHAGGALAGAGAWS